MNKKLKLAGIAAGVLVLALSGCKTLQETSQARNFIKPEGVSLMSEAELRSTLIGNTYEGESIRYPGSTYVEFIHPDGKISGLWNGDERYQGEWAISGSIWCYKYQDTRGCNTLSKSGNSIYWHDLDGTTRGAKSTLSAGDPKNLAR